MPKPAPSKAAIVTRFVILALALALLFEQAGARRLLHFEDAPDGVMMTQTYWFSLLAPIFYLAALWKASDVFVRLDRGETFGGAMVCGIRQIGACLMIGAFLAIVVQPSLIFLSDNGFRAMRGVRFDVTVENLALVLIGLVFVMLARRGRELQAQLDTFV